MTKGVNHNNGCGDVNANDKVNMHLMKREECLLLSSCL